jgi:hypothetical protein
MSNFTYNNNEVTYVTITRASGYGRYLMQADWIDEDGRSQSSEHISSSAPLFDLYTDEDTKEEARKIIAEAVIDNYYSL